MNESETVDKVVSSLKKNWVELNVDEKLERMRQVIKTYIKKQEETDKTINHITDIMSVHQHSSSNGSVLVPVNSNNRNKLVECGVKHDNWF